MSSKGDDEFQKALNDYALFSRTENIAKEHGCYVEKKSKKTGETISKYCFYLKDENGKVLKKVKSPASEGLEDAVIDFNTAVVVWKESREAKKLKEKVKKKEASEATEHQKGDK